MREIQDTSFINLDIFESSFLAKSGYIWDIISLIKFVKNFPFIEFLFAAYDIVDPSNTGAENVTPSPMLKTVPVVFPKEYKGKAAELAK